MGKTRPVRPPPAEADVDDDEEGAPAEPSENNTRTKNEAVEVEIVVPAISEVGPDEQLEGVGEVMNIIDKLVIVKGAPSGTANRGSEKALDSDTLLVFEDRKVLGYVRQRSILNLCLRNSVDLTPDIRDIWPHQRASISSQVQPEVPPRCREGPRRPPRIPRSCQKQLCFRTTTPATEGQ